METVDELLSDCRTALGDWITTYAPEFCDESAVRKARERISDDGGTLHYAGTLRSRIKRMLEQRASSANGDST